MQDERTLKMKQDFMSLHNEGLSMKEIAERFNLNVSTVYKSLDAIAKKEGCTREDLLKTVHSPHLTYDRQFEPVKEVDVKRYEKEFDALKKSAKELSNSLNSYITNMEKEATE